MAEKNDYISREDAIRKIAEFDMYSTQIEYVTASQDVEEYIKDARFKLKDVPSSDVVERERYERVKRNFKYLSDDYDELTKEVERDCRWDYEPITQTETQNSNKNSNVILVSDGVSEAIRCAMCNNPNKSYKGCDGACSYDEKLYKRIMDAIDELMVDTPQTERKDNG